MSHLINSFDLNRIENSLLVRRQQIVESTSWMFNMVLLGLVLLSFGYFLYVSYDTNNKEPDEKRIPFTPTNWYSATRNVRAEEYGGQPHSTLIAQDGYGVQGIAYGGGAETL